MTRLRVAFAQMNSTVGDFKTNEKKIASFLGQARRGGADLVLFPELAVTGYPPEDLLFKPSFITENLQVIRRLAPWTRGLIAVAGYADREGAHLYNAAGIFAGGRLAARYHKICLPNYGVFDEKRYFAPGRCPLVLQLVSGARRVPDTVFRIGVSICEDIWVENGPVKQEATAGAGLLINLSASPYHAGKRHEREQVARRWALRSRSWVGYVNLVGGQDELVFDGGSFLVAPSGRVVFRAPQFQEGLFVTEVPVRVSGTRLPAGSLAGRVPDTVFTVPVRWNLTRRRGGLSPSARPLPADEEIFQALVTGLKDYVLKNGFNHVVVGLSGGIDSALTAAIAVAALDDKRVTGVSMPSRYSSPETKTDAWRVAENLGISFLEIPIEPIFQATLATLRPIFQQRPADVTEENLQARIRGLLLMALSNKFHWLVLATGNKSELSTGYCTLYGDMVGGFAVIKDLPKTQVYRLSRTANRFFGRNVIPESVFRRPPTAELRPNQRDQDTLPPYAQLDKIVKAYVEEDQPAVRIRNRLKSPTQEIRRVLRMIDSNEYKRRQAPVGIKITPRAFGKDRRMPITNRFVET